MGPLAYSSRCLQCHGATGNGLASLYPPLAKSPWVQGDPAVLAAIVTQGLSGPVVVDGRRFDGAMPPHAHVDDRELAAILSYIRGQWGNAAPPVTADDVRAGRELSKDRRGPWDMQALQETLRLRAFEMEKRKAAEAGAVGDQ